QDDPGVAVADLGHLGAVAAALQLGPGPLGQQVHPHVPGVVPGVAVLVVGVAEPEHDPGAAGVAVAAGHRRLPPELERHRAPRPRAGPRPRPPPRPPGPPRPPRTRSPRSARPPTRPSPRGRRGSPRPPGP